MTLYDYGVSPPLTKADGHEPGTARQVQVFLPQAFLKGQRDSLTGEILIPVSEFQAWLTLCAERFDTLELSTPGIVTRCLRDYLDKLTVEEDVQIFGTGTT